MAVNVQGLDGSLIWSAEIDTTKLDANASQIDNKLGNIAQNVKRHGDELDAAFKKVALATTAEIKSIQSLSIQLQSYERIATKATDPSILIEYNKKIEQLSSEITRLKNAGKDGFDELGNAVEKSTNYFQKAWSGLKTLANILPGIGVAGIIAFATGPIIEYIKNLDIFKKKVTESELAQQTLNAALASKEYSEAVKNVNELRTNIDLAKNGFLDKKKVVDEYNDTIEKTTGLVSNLDQAEQALNKNAEAYIKFTLLKAEAQLALQDAAKKAYEAELAKNKDDDQSLNFFDKVFDILNRSGSAGEGASGNINQAAIAERERKQQAEKRRKEEADAANKQKDEFLKIAKDTQKQAADIAKQFKFNFFEDNGEGLKIGQSRADALLKQELDLQQKISQLRDKYRNQGLSKDDAEKQAIISQFKQYAFEINKANAEYDKFAKKFGQGAANKAGLFKVDPKSLDDIRQSAIDDYEAKREVEKTRLVTDQQKQLFKEYQDFKLKYGSEVADKVFSKDLGIKSYTDYLKSRLSTLQGKSDPTSNALKDYYNNELNKANAEEAKQVAVHLADLLAQTRTFNQQRAALEEKYQSDRLLLSKTGNEANLTELDRQHQLELDKIAVQQVQKLAAYQELFDGLHNLTKSKTEQDIQIVRNYIDSVFTDHNSEAYLKLRKELGGLDSNLRTLSLNKLDEAGKTIANIGQDLSGVNKQLSQMLTSLGETAIKFSSLQRNIDIITNPETSPLDKFQAKLNMISIIASSAISLISTITNASKQRKEAEEAYYNSVIAQQTQYNIAVTEQIRLQEELNQNVLLGKDYRKDLYNASIALSKANKDYADSLTKLQTGQAVIGQKSVADINNILKAAGAGAVVGSTFGIVGTIAGGIVGAIAGLFGGKKKIDVFAPLLAAYPDLIKSNGEFNESLAKTLIENNLVSDSTKAMLQNTIAYYDEVKAAQDQINQDIQQLAGSLSDDLSNSLVQAFEDGISAAQAFGDSVSKVIENIVSQFLFQDIFKGEFDKLSDNLKASFGVAGDQNAVDDLTQFFNNAGPLAQQYTDALKAAQAAAKANGLDIFKNNSTGGTPSSISGAVRGITEDQANAIEGPIRGIQLNVNELLAEAKAKSALAQKRLEYSLQNLQLAIKIESNTRRSADVSEQYLPYLQTISKNTGDSLSQMVKNSGKVN